MLKFKKMGNTFSLNEKDIERNYSYLIDDDKKINFIGAGIKGRREYMEDTHIISELNLHGHYLLCVFDGHSGYQFSQYLHDNLLSQNPLQYLI